MILDHSVRVLFAVVLINVFILLQALPNYEDICFSLLQNPYFEPDLVIGKPWRIYYSWNMQLEDKCLDMTYKNVTPAIVNRVFNDMYDYLESQPYWDGATLLVTMGRSHHEMLLFADQGAEGQFVGVPNVVRDGNITPNKNSVPLFKIHMKLFNDGKYLVLSDCNIGVSTLSGRRDRSFHREEISGVAANLSLGEGFAACLGNGNDVS